MNRKSKKTAGAARPAVRSTPNAWESASFVDWRELSRRLRQVHGLEEAVVTLQPDFVAAETLEHFDVFTMDVCNEESWLLAIGIGYQARLCLQLFRGKGTAETDWPPKLDRADALGCARKLYERQVNDRLVELMSHRDRRSIALVYLDPEGQVESESAHARAFCERHFPRGRSAEGYFPEAVWRFARGLVERRLPRSGRDMAKGVAFAVLGAEGLLHCQLRSMGADGFLWSLYAED